MFLRAKECLKKGRSVILDATFAKRKNREVAQKIARDLKVDFKIIEVVCPENIVKERMENRRGNASEARFQHYLEYKKTFQPIKEKHLIIDISKEFGIIKLKGG